MKKEVQKRVTIPEIGMDTQIRLTEAENKAFNAILLEHSMINGWALRRAIQLFIDKYSG